MEDTDVEIRVLFVDDELSVLEGIERSLFTCEQDDCEFEFAESAAAALDLFAEQPFDVLVSDMRMPEMDGSELLQRVAHEYPETIRMILSGQSELEAAMRAMPVAHQFLSKPTKPEELIANIRGGFGLRDSFNNPKVRAFAGDIEYMPARPEIYTKIVAILNADGSAAQVAEAVEQDPAIATKILHIANNAFFGRGAPVTNLGQAVARVGTRVVRDITMSMEAVAGFKEVDARELERSAEHSIQVASIARALPELKTVKELAFTAGLLHDIGHLIRVWKHPEASERIESLEESGLATTEAESQVLGLHHAELGAYLLGLWGLPFPVVEAVLFHHAPHPEHSSEISWSLYVAELAVSVTEGKSEDPSEVALVDRAGLRSQYETALSLAADMANGEGS